MCLIAYHHEAGNTRSIWSCRSNPSGENLKTLRQLLKRTSSSKSHSEIVRNPGRPRWSRNWGSKNQLPEDDQPGYRQKPLVPWDRPQRSLLAGAAPAWASSQRDDRRTSRSHQHELNEFLCKGNVLRAASLKCSRKILQKPMVMTALRHGTASLRALCHPSLLRTVGSPDRRVTSSSDEREPLTGAKVSPRGGAASLLNPRPSGNGRSNSNWSPSPRVSRISNPRKITGETEKRGQPRGRSVARRKANAGSSRLAIEELHKTIRFVAVCATISVCVWKITDAVVKIMDRPACDGSDHHLGRSGSRGHPDTAPLASGHLRADVDSRGLGWSLSIRAARRRRSLHERPEPGRNRAEGRRT